MGCRRPPATDGRACVDRYWTWFGYLSVREMRDISVPWEPQCGSRYRRAACKGI